AEIYLIQGKKSIDKLMDMDEKELKKYKFFLAMTKTVSSLIENDNDALNNLFNKTDISLKIFDEAHLEYENIISIDLLTTIPSIYLTATPSRSNYLENRVFQIVYSGVYKFTSTSKKIKNKREKYHRVIICKYDTEPSEEFLAKFKKASRSRGFNVNVYMNYILEEKIDKLYNNIKTLL